jgi:hypothetical protein
LSHYKNLRTGEITGESSFRNSASSRVENQLKAIKLKAREVKKNRVAIAFLPKE